MESHLTRLAVHEQSSAQITRMDQPPEIKEEWGLTLKCAPYLHMTTTAYELRLSHRMSACSSTCRRQGQSVQQVSAAYSLDSFFLTVVPKASSASGTG